MSCLFDSSLQFKCDIWEETRTQDENTGQIIRSFTKTGTFKCGIVAVSTQGKDGASLENSKKRDISKYDQFLYLTMNRNFSENCRVSNIRTQKDATLYIEPITNEATVFDIIGKTPVVDNIFGNSLGFKYLLNRSNMQGMTNEDVL